MVSRHLCTVFCLVIHVNSLWGGGARLLHTYDSNKQSIRSSNYSYYAGLLNNELVDIS